jgi:hypothetical protein
VFDADDLATASHESAHVVAAIWVGRQVISVSRVGADGKREGTTITAPGSDTPDVEAALVTLLAAVYVSGRGCGRDLDSALFLANESGADLNAANDRTRRLVADPAFRRDFRIIERALMSRPVLSGDDVAALLAR